MDVLVVVPEGAEELGHVVVVQPVVGMTAVATNRDEASLAE